MFYVSASQARVIKTPVSKSISGPFNIEEEDSLNASNVSLVKIFLKNGSIINYTNVDDAIRDFYKAIISNGFSLSDILNISVMRFQDYLAVLQNETYLNQTTYVPAYRLFFSILTNPSTYNYTGTIIPVNGYEFLYNTYGGKLTKCFMYGRLSSLRIIDVYGNEITMGDAKLALISYINATDTTLSSSVLDELNKTVAENSDIKVIVIDIANTLNKSAQYVQIYNKMYFANDFNTSIESNVNGTFSSFGFIATPAYVYIKNDLYVVRKSIGYEKASLMNQYIRVLTKSDNGLFSYIINDVSASNLVEGEKADIYIKVGDGFGNATLSVDYRILDENNNTLDSDTVNKEIQYNEWINFKIDLPNKSRTLILSVSVYSDNLPGSHIVISFKVKEREERTHEERFPWDLVTGIVLLLILIIVIGSYAYRYTVKEKYRKPRKRRRAKR